MGTTYSADSQWGAMKEGEDVACADTEVRDPRNWSTLPEDVLRRIFSMLPVADYLSLSGTSRFFYWFLMSQSKCHVPEETLIIHNGSLPPRKRYSPIWEKEKTRLTDIYSNRDWYFTQPRYLKKPFHVDDVYLFLHLGDFKGQIYDLCVSLIDPLREYCTNFNVTCVVDDRKRINIAATDEFLKAVHATYFTACEKIGHGENERYNCIVDYNYLSRPYLHTINEITVMNTSGRPADGILLNPIGIYMNPPLTMVIKTLNVFLYGTSRLLFHCYLVEGLTAEEIIDFLCLNFPFECLIEDGAIVWKRTIRSKYNSRVIKIWFSERNRRVQIHVGQADRFDGLHRRCFAYLRRSGEEQAEEEEEGGQVKQLAAGDGETEETDSGEEADTESGTDDEEDEEKEEED